MATSNATSNTTSKMSIACKSILGFQSKLPHDIAIDIERMAHVYRRKEGDIELIEQVIETLQYMQSNPKIYYENPTEVSRSCQQIATICSNIYDKDLLTQETSVTTFGARGHKYLYTWSLIGETTNIVITSTGGIQRCSICDIVPMSSEIKCTLDMDNWDGTVPGECLDGMSFSPGWFSAPTIFLCSFKKKLSDNLKI